MTVPSLPAALRAAAEGIYALESATGLIIAHGTWLDRTDFTRFVHHGTGTAAIDWEAAVAALDAGGLPSSAGEQRTAASCDDSRRSRVAAGHSIEALRVGEPAAPAHACRLNGGAGRILLCRQRGGRVLPWRRSARRGRTRSSARCCAGTQRCS
jgi:hypothetical protein